MASAKPDLADTGNPGYDDLNSDLFPNLIRADDGSDLNADLREFPAGADRGSDYLRKSLKQVLLGNYTGDVTALETLGQLALGLAGLDTAADIRDLTCDLTHWEWTPGHMGQDELGRAIEAAITAGISPRHRAMSPSMCPASRGSRLRPPSLSAIAAEKAV